MVHSDFGEMWQTSTEGKYIGLENKKQMELFVYYEIRPFDYFGQLPRAVWYQQSNNVARKSVFEQHINMNSAPEIKL